MPQESDSFVGSPLVDSAAEWLMSKALGDGEIREIFAGCCRRMVAAGIPIARSFLYYRTLHPLHASVFLIWERGESDVQVHELLHEGAFSSEEWLRSPMNYMLQNGVPYLRRRLVGSSAVVDFETLEFLQRKGATDYLGYVIPFSEDEEPGPTTDGIFGSWTTDRKSGFTRRDIQDLTRVQKRLAVACKVQIRREITHNVLTAYLGDEAGRKVLDGQIKRGDGRQVNAVIWYCDLRRSTEMAEALENDAYLDLLNRYFECTAGSVLASGGEVLSFIGDAVLAIYPIDAEGADAHSAAQAALEAANAARVELKALNASRPGEAPVNFGLGLHVGRVMHGNIGVPQRVDFTVIGPAANEVARLEELTKTLGPDVLVSAAFADLLPDVAWEDLGAHDLRGAVRPLAVLAAPETQR
ncbi:MAG: adenylate cyclase [Hyphomicrobiaceae bacterium]|jgi:adenylate cyclase